MSFIIRKAEETDVPVILHFINAIAEYEKLTHLVEATAENITNTMFGEKPFAECLLGFESDVPIGFALYFHNYSTFVSRPGIYLEDLFVEPAHRGKGYGKALLLKLVSIAKEMNCGRVEWSVLNWNKPAIDFYQSFGAKPMDEWTVYRLNEEDIRRLAD